MSRQTRPSIASALSHVALTLSVVGVVLLLNAGYVLAQSPDAATPVPAAIAPGAAESLVLVTPATGVQIYECRASSRPGEYEWVFVAPEADLFDTQGRRIGRHYDGPHWEAADGSRIVASVKARADAPDGAAIPWLLLSARSVGADGALSKVTSIQRTHTVGGLPPQMGCSRSTLGVSARVHYSAQYRFFRNGGD